MTSEEKLLNLIRTKEKTVQAKLSKAPASDKSSKVVGNKTDLLKNLNILIAVISFFILSYLLTKYFSMDKRELYQWSSGSEASKKDAPLPSVSKLETRSFSDYEGRIKQRDFFEFPWEKTNTMAANAPANPVSDLSKQFKLVGIVLDRDPKAIIEDLRTKETLFMSKGERIGDAVLQDIQEDKAIFLYNNEKIELSQ